MLLVLPVLALLAMYWLILVLSPGIEKRLALLGAAVFWATCLLFITEALSLEHLITRINVAVGWALILVAALAGIAFRRRASAPVEPALATKLDPASRNLLVAAGGVASIVLVVAIAAPPSTWDAMEYHLPRMTMWISNHSVQFYATPDYAQLIWGPWAEYAMMHLDLLWGNDRLVNLVEFVSFLGSIVGASFLAKLLGAGLRGQALAAVLCATIPEGVLEASGPMNTYVVSFWILTTAIFLIHWNRGRSALDTVCIGLSAGLALLTKGSAYVYLPMIVCACWWMGSKISRISFLKRGIVFLVLIVSINGPHYYRCWQLTGSPLGFPLAVHYPRLQIVVDHVSLRQTTANVLRNIALHIGTPSNRLNQKIDHAFRSSIQMLGVNPDDPGAMYLNLPFHVPNFSLHEVHAGNPIHLLVLMLALSLLILKRSWKDNRVAFWYGSGLICAFLLMSAALRWTEWSSRYHLALFVLSTALVGVVLERYASQKAAYGVAVGVLILAVPFAAVNRIRSLIPWGRVENVYHTRPFLYFSDQHQRVAQANIAAAEAINRSQCHDIALDTYLENSEIGLSPISQFVYPMLSLIHADNENHRVWYTGVRNSTNRYTTGRRPCAVICFDCARVPAKLAQYQESVGSPLVFDYIVVFNSRQQGESATLQSRGTGEAAPFAVR